MKSRLDEYKTQLYLYLCSKFINYPFFIFLWYRLNKTRLKKILIFICILMTVALIIGYYMIKSQGMILYIAVVAYALHIAMNARF